MPVGAGKQMCLEWRALAESEFAGRELLKEGARGGRLWPTGGTWGPGAIFRRVALAPRARAGHKDCDRRVQSIAGVRPILSMVMKLGVRKSMVMKLGVRKSHGRRMRGKIPDCN